MRCAAAPAWPDRGRAVVFAALLSRSICRDVGPARAPLGAVAPGPVGAGVKERGVARGRLAEPEPVDADLGGEHREPHDRASRVLVRDRSAFRQVEMPTLAVMARYLRVEIGRAHV